MGETAWVEQVVQIDNKNELQNEYLVLQNGSKGIFRVEISKSKTEVKELKLGFEVQSFYLKGNELTCALKNDSKLVKISLI